MDPKCSHDPSLSSTASSPFSCLPRTRDLTPFLCPVNNCPLSGASVKQASPQGLFTCHLLLRTTSGGSYHKWHIMKKSLGSLDTLSDFINLPQLTNSLMEGSQITAILTELQQRGQVSNQIWQRIISLCKQLSKVLRGCQIFPCILGHLL